jgi:lipoprotein-releasing system permease protein
MIIATSLINGFQKEIRNKVFGFWAHISIVPFSLTKSFEESGTYLYQDFYTDKRVIPEAAHIQAVAIKAGLLKTRDAFEGIALKGIGNDFNTTFFQPYLKEGVMLSTDSNVSRKQLIVSTATAKRMDLKLGDKVTVNFVGNKIRTRGFNVCGIYETGLDEFDKQFALSSISVIQDLNNWGRDTVGGFEIFLKENNLFKSRAKAYFLTVFGALLPSEYAAELRTDPLDKIADDIYYRMSNANLDVQTIKYQNPGIFDWLELQTMNELIILSLMIIVAAINMMTALLILILERTNMIGILKALGSTNGSIRKMFIYYALVIIGGGLLIGNVLGISLCLLQKHYQLVKLPQESYYISSAPIDLNLAWIFTLNLLTLFICTLLLLLPSRIIANISPVKAIRFD